MNTEISPRQLYRFSPITTQTKFNQAIEYTTHQVELLGQKLTHKTLPITNIKIFAHYPEEYDRFTQWIKTYGPVALQNATSVYVDASLTILGHHLTRLGIRIPDPYRFQVGCGDYQLDNWTAFRAAHLDPTHHFVRDLPGREDQFLELWHPDFDVAGYVPKR